MAIVDLLITLIIWGLIFYVIWWAINQIPMPEPIRTVVRVIFVLAIVLVLLNLLGLFAPGTRLTPLTITR